MNNRSACRATEGKTLREDGLHLRDLRRADCQLPGACQFCGFKSAASNGLLGPTDEAELGENCGYQEVVDFGKSSSIAASNWRSMGLLASRARKAALRAR